ncbi:hypothetical protein JOC55_003091 [Paenibacillus sacheonensis]|nr:hypothetical protein [Paenibacillus sacheonensis]
MEDSVVNDALKWTKYFLLPLGEYETKMNFMQLMSIRPVHLSQIGAYKTKRIERNLH